MKLLIISLLSFFSATVAVAQSSTIKESYQRDGWTQMDKGYWSTTENGQTVWCRLEASGELSRSKDGVNFSVDNNGAWRDRMGRKITVRDNTITVSDQGRDWVPLVNREWVGPDGKFYMMDAGRNMWVRQHSILR